MASKAGLGMWRGLGTSAVCLHPDKKNGFWASFFEKLPSPVRRAVGISPELLCGSTRRLGRLTVSVLCPKEGRCCSSRAGGDERRAGGSRHPRGIVGGPNLWLWHC